jgi:hypothetical protein
MTQHLPRVLSACAAPLVLLLAVSTASAAGFCGPGCHATIFGACVADGWGTGARVWNECPATTRPRPSCGGSDYVWDSRKKACFPTHRDWI